MKQQYIYKASDEMDAILEKYETAIMEHGFRYEDINTTDVIKEFQPELTETVEQIKSKVECYFADAKEDHDLHMPFVQKIIRENREESKLDWAILHIND